MTSSEYMSIYRNQLILHINNWKYTSNYSLKEVISILKYLHGKLRHVNLAKISEIPKCHQTHPFWLISGFKNF